MTAASGAAFGEMCLSYKKHYAKVRFSVYALMDRSQCQPALNDAAARNLTPFWPLCLPGPFFPVLR